LRRDRPQASRSRNRRADRPILSPRSLAAPSPGIRILPGCWFGARCRAGVGNVSSPHQGRDLPRRALREDGCWRRMAARPARATRRAASAASGPPAGRGSGGRHVRALTRWACSSDPKRGRCLCTRLCTGVHNLPCSASTLHRSGNCCAGFSYRRIESDRCSYVCQGCG
jgi:hypothetical protein